MLLWPKTVRIKLSSDRALFHSIVLTRPFVLTSIKATEF
ncbi:hypothetical protein OHAE_1691 [Ochrobactrum soli]|uniref:Uncharacterized protein n=1 Tax=Ochrobactrum soli TaxID=2448455 RepID=A0A2P9HNY9_9HYPH|nr:hypothetical protein OHAE_1691 [[Ochrobactrum] soli]